MNTTKDKNYMVKIPPTMEVWNSALRKLYANLDLRLLYAELRIAERLMNHRKVKK